jgi:hypothetical protein
MSKVRDDDPERKAAAKFFFFFLLDKEGGCRVLEKETGVAERHPRF